MLFPWEILLHQVLLVTLLVFSSIIAIIINKADLTGKKKYSLFKFIRMYGLFFLVPASLILFFLNIWGISQMEFITLQKATYRATMALAGFIALLLAIFKIIPNSIKGMKEVRKKSITASKYQKLFQQLRANFITIMLSVAIAFWIMYINR